MPKAPRASSTEYKGNQMEKKPGHILNCVILLEPGLGLPRAVVRISGLRWPVGTPEYNMLALQRPESEPGIKVPSESATDFCVSQPSRKVFSDFRVLWSVFKVSRLSNHNIYKKDTWTSFPDCVPLAAHVLLPQLRLYWIALKKVDTVHVSILVEMLWVLPSAWYWL